MISIGEDVYVCDGCGGYLYEIWIFLWLYIQIVYLLPPLEKQLSLYAYIFNHSNYNASSADGLFSGSIHNNLSKNCSTFNDSYWEKL